MYPASIDRIPGINQYLAGNNYAIPIAQRTAETILTLPTHAYVSTSDLKKIQQILLDI